MQTINKYLAAAIIGYWRSGATIEEIIGATGLTACEIEKVFPGHIKNIIVAEYDKELNATIIQ